MPKTSEGNEKYDVALIGLGPVGCCAAILLAEAGLRVVAIEREAEVYALPRAVNLDGEIIRAFQQVGRGQAVQDLMQTVRPDDRAGFANSKREWLFGQKSRSFGRNGWQPGNMFDQPEVESYLRTEATEHENVDALIGFEMTNFEQQPDGVQVTHQPVGSDSRVTVTAQYLIACDGASSSVRKALGIGWQDLGYDHEWLVVDVVLKSGHTLDNSTVQVCDPDRIHTYVATKDPFRRWEFKMLPGETSAAMLRPETIHTLIDPWTPRDTYEIRRAAVYQFHAANADRWRAGRVFIAGDAAHQTPPFLGQGMNTGMRDAINLAWKLPLVVKGIAHEALLDTYFDERAAHAHDLVAWAVSIGQLMEHMAEQERCAREGLDPPATPSDLGSSGYGQGREQPPIRAGVVMVEQVSDSGSAGHLFRQPIVRSTGLGARDDDQAGVRFDDYMGHGFALVIKGEAQPALNAKSRDIMQRLGVKIVTLDGLEAIQGHFDSVFEQYDAVMVRPDRLIFGHTSTQVSLDLLVLQLADQLALTDR